VNQLLTSFWDTATRSNAFKNIKTSKRACGNYGRLAVSIHRNTAVRAGVNRERHRDCVHMRPEYFDGIQMLEDFPVMADLRWDDVKDVY